MNAEQDKTEETKYGMPIYECTGCGELARNPSDHITELNIGGFISCCPDSNFKLVRESLTADRPSHALAQDELAIREELALMDRFAIAAMGMFSHSFDDDSPDYEDFACWAYCYAEAMVLERATIWREISERTYIARQVNESQD